MEISSRFSIYETNDWLLSHRMDCALPGYLMLSAKFGSDALAQLPREALVSLGPLLAASQGAMKQLFQPKWSYVGRYGHTAGLPIHFHLMPVYDWVEKLFWRDPRYRGLQNFASRSAELTDGAELTLFIWREFCERPDPPQIEGPTVEEAIEMMRQAMKDHS